MKSLCLLLCSLVAVHGSGFHKFMSKYATIKVLSSCLGEEFMSQWHNNYTKTVDYCQHENPEPFTRLMFTAISPEQSGPTFLSQNDFNPAGVNPFLDQVKGPGLLDLNDVLAALQDPSTNQPILLVPIPPNVLQQPNPAELRSAFFLRRSKRAFPQNRHDSEPYFDQEKIDRIHQAVILKASNFTCIVNKMNIFDSNYDVNYNVMVNHVRRLPIDEELKGDIEEGIFDCIKFTECKPLKKMSFVPSSVQRAASFLKCELKQKLSACVKNDLQRKQNKFDKEALRNVGNNQDMDEGDKMFALMFGELMHGSKKGYA